MTMAGEDGTSKTSTETQAESGASKDAPQHGNSLSEQRPALPPRPVAVQSPPRSQSPISRTPSTKRPQLQSQPTTAISSIDIQTLSFPDGSRGTFSVSGEHLNAASVSGIRRVSQKSSDADDGASLTSYAPSLRAGGDLESLLGNGINSQSPAWKLLQSQTESTNLFESIEFNEDDKISSFEHEFDEVPDVDSERNNEEDCLLQWKSKLKHYLILSSAGKPIYSRHGDQNLINGYIGIIQTIISFYEGANDQLKGFTADGARFVVTTEGPLYFVAISRLEESDAQLRAQLEALYMQILSTLTLPTLTHLFTNRPSTDLRRPLQGTEPLLSSLADTFTKGSASALLSALECLKIRKSERHVINNALLKTRNEKLLYGLIVAGGRLVSVIRPKRHSLHPSDLQLIFNMLFEAGSIKGGGGENWIPLCLPGFNNRGYLYMYVSFLDSSSNNAGSDSPPSTSGSSGKDDEVAVLLISADKESFFELKQMRDDLVVLLDKNGSLALIKEVVRKGRPRVTDTVPGTQMLHFLYKSRANVQFTMPSFSPHFNTLIARRRLLSLYHSLQASAHAKHTHLKIIRCVRRDSMSLVWVTPIFEFYCVAGPNTSGAGLAQGANKIIQWVKREEQRVFIIGGAVF